MRPIKFRAWDKEDKEMLYGVSLQFREWQGKEYLTLQHEDWAVDGEPENNPDWEGLREPEEIELMQFTGLHDKNGKEIWEGDILQYEDGSYGKPHLVEWSRYNFTGFTPFCDNHSFRQEMFEVIGNIYENPELLGYSEG